MALARQIGSETIEFIQSRLEGKFQLEVNREKTRVMDLREEGVSLSFVGYTFRYDRDLKERDRGLPECVSVEEGDPAGAREATGDDESSSKP